MTDFKIKEGQDKAKEIVLTWLSGEKASDKPNQWIDTEQMAFIFRCFLTLYGEKYGNE